MLGIIGGMYTYAMIKVRVSRLGFQPVSSYHYSTPILHSDLPPTTYFVTTQPILSAGFLTGGTLYSEKKMVPEIFYYCVFSP